MEETNETILMEIAHAVRSQKKLQARIGLVPNPGTTDWLRITANNRMTLAAYQEFEADRRIQLAKG